MSFFSNIFGKKTANKSSKATPTPPSEDVKIFGCDPSCGYFIANLKELSNGTYEAVKKNGKMMGYCKYQKTAVRVSDHCKFAEDHPDKLEESVFS